MDVVTGTVKVIDSVLDVSPIFLVFFYVPLRSSTSLVHKSTGSSSSSAHPTSSSSLSASLKYFLPLAGPYALQFQRFAPFDSEEQCDGALSVLAQHLLRLCKLTSLSQYPQLYTKEWALLTGFPPGYSPSIHYDQCYSLMRTLRQVTGPSGVAVAAGRKRSHPVCV